ncbi:MAG: hypothetical protein U1E25_02135 [Methylocystis sp.]
MLTAVRAAPPVRSARCAAAAARHWTYDLNRHISLLVAHREETARLHRLLKGA